MRYEIETPRLLRREQALAFIIERIARDGVSPSLEEIAGELGVSKPRARQLVDQLVDLDMIERRPGALRNLRVRDVAQCRTTLDLTLRRLGWAAANPLGDLEQPLPKVQLSLLPPFQHLPDVD